MKAKIKAVIFDMDGVISDTEPFKFDAYKLVFKEEFGITIEEDTERIGKHESAVMELYLHKYGLKADISDLVQKKRRTYYRLLEHSPDVKLFKGVMKLLSFLEKEGFILGLATSSDIRSADIILNRFGLSKFFNSVVTQEDVECKKPDPDMYLKSARELVISPIECMVFEDSPTGIEAAKRAGMWCVGFISSLPEEELLRAGADFVVSSFKDQDFKKVINFVKGVK